MFRLRPGPAKNPSWGVAALVDEPLPLVQAFVAHHLEQGAAEIQLFPDGPDPALERAMARHRAVRVEPAGAEGRWHPKTKRPPRLAMRLRLTAQRAFRRSRTDWMLFCDVDEFVSDGARLHRELAAMPDTVEQVRLRVAERIFCGRPPGEHVFEGAFRLAMPPGEDPTAVYGDGAAYLQRGLAGHVLGKSLYRTGAEIAPGVHMGSLPEARGGGDPESRMAEGVLLHHFDGLTPLNWAIKLKRKVLMRAPPGGQVRHPGRIAQIERAKTGTLAECVALYWELMDLTPETLQRLERHQLLDRGGFDPRPAMAKRWRGAAGGAAALAPEAYDALLVERYGSTLDGV